jgi:hypothetical protein
MNIRIAFQKVQKEGNVITSIGLNPSQVNYTVILDNSEIDFELDPDNENVLFFNTPTPYVFENHVLEVNASIVVSESDYDSNDYSEDYNAGVTGTIDFNKVFNIHGFDIGNNGVTVTGNPDFVISFVDNLDTRDTSYASFTGWRRPNSHTVSLYNMSATNLKNINYISSGSYYSIENTSGEVVTVVGEDVTHTDPDILDVRFTLNTVIFDVDDSHTSTVKHIIEDKKHYPTISVMDPGCINCTEGTFNTESINSLGVKLDYSGMMHYTVNDFTRWFINSTSVEFSLTDNSAYPTQVSMDSHVLNSYPTENNQHLFLYEFKTPVFGDYKIDTTVTNKYGFDSSVTVSRNDYCRNIKNADYIQLVKEDITNYKIYNWSNNVEEVDILILDDTTGVFMLDKTITIQPLNTAHIEFTHDGVYQLRYADKSLVIPIYKVLRDCVDNLIKDVICNPYDKCNEKAENDFLRVWLTSQTFWLLLNKLPDFDYVQYSLPDSLLDDYIELSQAIHKVYSYCKECSQGSTYDNQSDLTANTYKVPSSQYYKYYDCGCNK